MKRKMMVVLIALAFGFSTIFFMASCAKKQVKIEEAKPARKAPPPPPVRVGEDEAYKQREAERLARLRAMEAEQRLKEEVREFEADRIYFDFDRSELKPESKAILTKKADWLRKNPQFSVRIEGNCDERGTNEYNLALGERRANAAWKYLNALGISGSRLSTISYGEERPLDSRSSESAWAKNRNDGFKLIE
jgi:peptidoglycan-associated lipoprotein